MTHWTGYLMSGILALSSVVAATNIAPFQKSVSSLEQSVQNLEEVGQNIEDTKYSQRILIDLMKQSDYPVDQRSLEEAKLGILEAKSEELKIGSKVSEQYIAIGNGLKYVLWGIAIGGPVAAFFTFPRRKKVKGE